MTGVRKTKGTYTVGVVTKEAVLNESIRLLTAKGYYGFSLRDVARVVGISHPAVIYHFPTKEALLYAAMKRCEDKMGILNVQLDAEGAQLIDKGIIPDTIGMLGMTMLDLAISDHFKAAVAFDLAMAVEARTVTHPLHGHYQFKFSTLTAFLAAGIGLLKEAGTVPTERNAELAAERFVSLWYGSILTSHYARTTEPGTSLVGQFLAEVGRILGLKSEAILEIAVAIPERLAPAFQKVMRANQLIS